MALNSFRIEGLAALESVLISHGSVTMHSEDFDASCLILLDLLSSDFMWFYLSDIICVSVRESNFIFNVFVITRFYTPHDQGVVIAGVTPAICKCTESSNSGTQVHQYL